MMTKRSPLFLSLVAGALTFVVTACGGSPSSLTTPTPTQTAPAAPAGATIVGTVQVAGATAIGGLRASSSGLHVSVVGTTLSASIDGSGRFTLTGVPSGRVELHFEGSGIDARLEVAGLQSGQTLTITVHLSSNTASLEPDEGENVEVKGTIENLNPLTVAGRTITTDANTKVLGEEHQTLTLADLKVGDKVEIDGQKLSDGSVLARTIKVESGGSEDGGEEVELKGTIQSLSPLTVAGKTIMTDANTRILGGEDHVLTLAELKVGDRVEVEGTGQPSGSILAKKITVEGGDD